MKITFWFEFASTYSYPAAMRVEDAARRAGVAVEWKAFLLGPIFKTQGWEDSPFNLYPAKGRYMWRDLERTCASLGIPFRRPSRFPRGSLAAARIAALHSSEPWMGAFVRAVYAANFASDLDIGHDDVLRRVLGEAGLDPALVDHAALGEAKEALRANTAEAAGAGVFGAPSFTVGDELFWGNDRLEAALAWKTQAG